MSGATFIELIVCCLLLALVGAGGMVVNGRAHGTRSPETCTAPLELFLAHARAKSVASGIDSRVRFDLEKNEAVGNWAEPPLELGSVCRLRAASFGVGGRSAKTAVFYPSGSASPGSVLVVSASGGSCRVTIGLRGGEARRCTP